MGARDGRHDPHRLTQVQTRTAVLKLLMTSQESRYHGDVTLKFRAGALVHVDFTQSALPRDILEDRFVCALVRGKNVQDVSDQDAGA